MTVADTLAQHQIEEVHEDPTGYLIVVCYCGAHIDHVLGARIGNRASARAALAEHQAAELRKGRGLSTSHWPTETSAVPEHASENLARWREAELGAPANWYTEQSREWLRVALDPYGYQDVGEVDRIIDLIVAARTAMTSLLSFAESVVVLHVPRTGYDGSYCTLCQSSPGAGYWPCPTARLAEQHLGGAS